MRRLSFWVAALISASVLSGWAGDYNDLNFLGFSEDGRYLAFEESGIGDGSGLPYRYFTFVDVDKNSWQGQPLSYQELEKDSDFSRMRQESVRRIKQLRIKKGNIGSHVVSHLLTDIGLRAEHDHHVRFAKAVGSAWSTGDYELVLTPARVPNPQCEDAQIFELTLTNLENKKSVLLQKDTKMPAKRNPCTDGYRIQDVYVYNDRIAVFIAMFAPGFEGPNMSFICVTGILP